MNATRYQRELSAAAALAGLLAVVALRAPSFFAAGNLRDLAVNNSPALLVAAGMTLVILVGDIDISVASQFAVCSVACGWLVKLGLPTVAMVPLVLAAGMLMGACNGALIAFAGLPSIIVTLAMLVAWRDALRWATGGAWVQGLPADFQWLGMSQSAAQWVIVACSVGIVALIAWAMRYMTGMRGLYAVGSDADAARLAGLDPVRVRFMVFVAMGGLVAVGAMLNAIRFSSIPGNAGAGLELKTIAAVVVGGTAITGGRGNLLGTFIGVMLLSAIGTALSFVGINPFWERAIQGLIILMALGADYAFARWNPRALVPARAHDG